MSKGIKKLEEKILEASSADLRKSYYSLSDGIHQFRDTDVAKNDHKVKAWVRDLLNINHSIYAHLEKNYKGWD